MKIIILTSRSNSSPKILAASLKEQLEEAGVSVEISYKIDLLKRLVSYRDSAQNFHFWLKKKAANYFSDRNHVKRLKKADAVIVSECIPNAFWNHLYNVEKLKAVTGKLVFLYEVYHLGNAPTQMDALRKSNDPLLERYDGYLFVSPITEIRRKDLSKAFCVGLLSKKWNLIPSPKKDLVALVDFIQPGYEAYRSTQIGALKKAGISYISLEKKYSIEEIRDIYRRVSVFFIQFPEAFGLPILECLCTGAQVFTPNSGWPMSWRLDDEPKVHEGGVLPGCFTVYKGEDDLLEKLLLFKNNYDPVLTPIQVHDIFIQNYPDFYEGNRTALDKCIEFIEKEVS